MDPNREFHELIGGKCWHGHDSDNPDFMETCPKYNLIYYGDQETTPDYAADPRLVLREMAKREDFPLFMARLMYVDDNVEGIDWDHNIDIGYFIDSNGELETTGKLVKDAIKFLKEKEGI